MEGAGRRAGGARLMGGQSGRPGISMHLPWRWQAWAARGSPPIKMSSMRAQGWRAGAAAATALTASPASPPPPLPPRLRGPAGQRGSLARQRGPCWGLAGAPLPAPPNRASFVSRRPFLPSLPRPRRRDGLEGTGSLHHSGALQDGLILNKLKKKVKT